MAWFAGHPFRTGICFHLLSQGIASGCIGCAFQAREVRLLPTLPLGTDFRSSPADTFVVLERDRGVQDKLARLSHEIRVTGGPGDDLCENVQGV